MPKFSQTSTIHQTVTNAHCQLLFYWCLFWSNSRSGNVPSVLWRCWLGSRKRIEPV